MFEEYDGMIILEPRIEAERITVRGVPRGNLLISIPDGFSRPRPLSHGYQGSEMRRAIHPGGEHGAREKHVNRRQSTGDRPVDRGRGHTEGRQLLLTITMGRMMSL
jgi:hypothetical protein